MKSIEFKVNANIIIIKDEKRYKSIIEDVTDKEFFINIPVNEGEYLTLENEEELECYYYVEGGNYYRFFTKVIGRKVEKDLPMYKVVKPESIEKIQRRNYVRVSLTEYAIYKKHTEEGFEWQQCILLDLSGGGLKIKLEKHLNINDEIVINIYCGDESCEVVGKVVRCEKNSSKEYICGIEFQDLDERQRDKIVKKVFEVMRKQREVI
ncbi:MAG: PilZ domain-containing protein [Clostridiaceae bacterium]|nr:PilZ domain-containing protein [Clostridiaceae bacterium]